VVAVDDPDRAEADRHPRWRAGRRAVGISSLPVGLTAERRQAPARAGGGLEFSVRSATIIWTPPVRPRAAARDFRLGPGRERSLSPPGKEGEMSTLHLPMTVIVGAVPGAITWAIEQKRKASE